ncbi:MAG TPA: polyhydroxyalkanoic acid system family protein [Lacipirellulaceae bacterium]|nr:polyhydroxyalkanoic acid system family protein [Lacipirellulaceae bacterium]HMP05168.1 polyhydroxyalkanoic acid system family protein [Lacipirellulaceae bacterium]
MPKFHFEIPHTLPADEARSRLERFAESLQLKFADKVSDLNQQWNGNTLAFGFKTFGIKIAGDVTALDQKLDVNGEIPLTAMMFKGKIESEVREQLARLMRA